MMSLRIGSVVEDFHNVVTDKHVLSFGDELAIRAAGVICEALLAIGPVGNQDHHPSSLFDENRMCDQTVRVLTCSCIFTITSRASSSVAASQIIILVLAIWLLLLGWV